MAALSEGRPEEGRGPMRRTVTGALGIGLLDAFLLEALPGGAVALAESVRHGNRLPPGIDEERRNALAALQPRIYTRGDWGARPPRKRAKILARPPRNIVVHHTATRNYPDESLQHACWLSRWIQRHHMRNRGWADTGQQLTISRGGYVMEGRNRSLSAIQNGRLAVGAHVRGHNRTTIGIENEGTYMEEEVPPRLWDSLERVCAWLCGQYELDPYRAIVGHRDFGDTDCPGDVLYELLPDLRRGVADRLERSIRRSQPKKPRAGKKADSPHSPTSRPDADASAELSTSLDTADSSGSSRRPSPDRTGAAPEMGSTSPSVRPQQTAGTTNTPPLPNPPE